jgi:hypothetical protein
VLTVACCSAYARFTNEIDARDDAADEIDVDI